MTVGYDPERIRGLTDRTRASLDALDALRSTDPSAAEAMRAVRLLRRHLEDHWMPALLEIQRSEAMVSWARAGLELPWWMGSRPTGAAQLPDHLRPPESPTTELSGLSDEDLVALVTRVDRILRPDHPTDPSAPPDPTVDLDVLARELGRRTAIDAAFADRAAELAASTPLIGFLTARAGFASSFGARLVTSMMGPDGRATTADLDRYAESLSTALAALVGDPSTCLDLLLDRVVLHGIASWERLDSDVVSEFVVAGLHTAIADEPDRLAEGYRVLESLTALTNGPLDRGLHPAMAVSVAASMVGYIDTLAPAIRQEGGYPVLVVGPDLEIELGTYDDVVDLFGSLLRDTGAQAALGAVLGAYATSIVAGLGADIASSPGLEYVTRFTDLIADASRTEQAELVLQAAAQEARRRQVGAMIGFGTSAALSASGVGSVAGAVVSHAISVTTNLAARVEPTKLPDRRLPSAIYDLITVEVLTVVARSRPERRRAGLAAVRTGSWSELEQRLDEILDEADPDERTRQVLRLDHWIEAEVPLLGGYLGRVRSAPGMDELTEARIAVGTD